MGPLGLCVERILHIGREGIDVLLRRLRKTRRRHQAPAQFLQHFLPSGCIGGGLLRVQAFQHQSARLQARAVTAHAVGVQHFLMRVGGQPQPGFDLPLGLSGAETGAIRATRRTYIKEAFHTQEPIARSIFCGRRSNISSLLFYHKHDVSERLSCYTLPDWLDVDWGMNDEVVVLFFQ